MTMRIALLGRVNYPDALALQEKLWHLRLRNEIPDTMILLEHPPVLTLGVRGEKVNVLLPEAFFKSQGVEIHKVQRGGDVTYHGPGQIVGYPIFNLKDHGKNLHEFVDKLKNIFIELLKNEYAISAVGGDGLYTGVWVGDEKITALGLSFNRWITMHGFAFNVNTNLDHFKWINPCGFTDKGVTSLEKLVGEKLDLTRVNEQVIQYFSHIFQTSIEYTDRDALDLLTEV